MNDHSIIDFVKAGLKSMKLNEVAYLLVQKEEHGGMYHKGKLQGLRSEDEIKTLFNQVNSNDPIYMKLTLTSIKRNPKGPSQDASYEEKMKFY